MKKGKWVEKNKSRFVFGFLLLLLVALVAVVYFSGLFGKITGLDTKGVGLNITVGGPSIVTVENGTGSSSLTLTSSGSVNKSINVTVYDGASTSFLNDSTLFLNASASGLGTGEVTRNASCGRTNASTNYAYYSCNITMWWFDGTGNWSLYAFIMDNSSNTASNSTQVFYVNSLTGFSIAPVNLTFNAMAPGSTNQTSNNDPLNLTNTGNQQFGISSGNISINSTDLAGETNGGYDLFAKNFTVSTITGGSVCSGSGCTECSNASGSNMNMGFYKNISTATLPKGNYTVGDTSTGRAQLYFCLKLAGAELTSQSYSTKSNGTWTVMIS